MQDDKAAINTRRREEGAKMALSSLSRERANA
jgi:hypothetical protein